MFPCTDIGDDVLHLCAKNAETNRKEYIHDAGKELQSVIHVQELDWTKYQLGTGKCMAV